MKLHHEWRRFHFKIGDDQHRKEFLILIRWNVWKMCLIFDGFLWVRFVLIFHFYSLLHKIKKKTHNRTKIHQNGSIKTIIGWIRRKQYDMFIYIFIYIRMIGIESLLCVQFNHFIRYILRNTHIDRTECIRKMRERLQIQVDKEWTQKKIHREKSGIYDHRQ